jgi:hypothetical protein
MPNYLSTDDEILIRIESKLEKLLSKEQQPQKPEWLTSEQYVKNYLSQTGHFKTILILGLLVLQNYREGIISIIQKLKKSFGKIIDHRLLKTDQYIL